MVDSLDTLYLYGMQFEMKEAIDYIISRVNFDYANDHTSVFESTIRLLGGLISIHYLDPNIDYTGKLTLLGQKLIKAFSTDALPFPDINLADGKGHYSRWSSMLSLSEFTTIQMEFNQLARILNQPSYSISGLGPLSLVLKRNQGRKILPIMFKGPSGVPDPSSPITLGARGDSYYEYLLKVWVQTGKQSDLLKNAYIDAISEIMTRMSGRSQPNGYLFIGELLSGNAFSSKMDHLVCFLPGTLAYGYLHGMPKNHLHIAKELMAGCYQFYNQTTTGLAPEIVVWNTEKTTSTLDFYIKSADGHCLLRPETVESLFYLYRITKDPIYREWGWSIFQAFNKYARLPDNGFASVADVMQTPPVHLDKMESFFLAETMKYFLLLFDDAAAAKVDLSTWVFNTEAHPFPLDPSDRDFYKPILDKVASRLLRRVRSIGKEFPIKTFVLGTALGSFSTLLYLHPGMLVHKAYAAETLFEPAGKFLTTPDLLTQHKGNHFVAQFECVGFPQDAPVRVFDAFIVGYDRRNRIPRWVLEHLVNSKMSGQRPIDRSAFTFYEDQLEEEAFRSTLSDYRRSGYDRGHMAAAGNYLYEDSPNKMNQTFILSNITPQVGKGFNRDAWNELEKYIRRMAKHSADLFVLTGPLFLPRMDPATKKKSITYEVIGTQNVAVPTHFYKVCAVKEKPNSPWKLLAWVMPNIVMPTENINVNQFLVPVQDVEKAAGLRFFSNLPRFS
ncbi:Endoplasmic reticulum mannosyl-oligosaccharide 1,2-alpha-mannosidase [Cichlidogyrus casuarinus]|uniref:alpha-1,2-Mannosidase n=1 Tax=Cichlidogyrus casuarinus TaxID=1844966 RepID=A0ABD2Q5Y4_9PLAT